MYPSITVARIGRELATLFMSMFKLIVRKIGYRARDLFASKGYTVDDSFHFCLKEFFRAKMCVRMCHDVHWLLLTRVEFIYFSMCLAQLCNSSAALSEHYLPTGLPTGTTKWYSLLPMLYPDPNQGYWFH